jgi:hypothetical protein
MCFIREYDSSLIQKTQIKIKKKQKNVYLYFLNIGIYIRKFKNRLFCFEVESPSTEVH